MNPQTPQPLPADPSNRHSIETMSADGEEKLYEVRKHPFGIIMLYIEAIGGLGVGLGLVYFLIQQFVTDANRDQINGILLLVTIVTIAITLVILFLASVVYHQSYLIMTNKNVTQVLQQGLFKRKVSELTLSNIEDVTAEQRGLIQTLFNFGTLRVETAGEVENFDFPYCPKPNYCGKILLDARQRYVEADPVRAHMGNDRINLPPAPYYQAPPQMSPQPTYDQTPVPPEPSVQPPAPAPMPSQPPEMPPQN